MAFDKRVVTSLVIGASGGIGAALADAIAAAGEKVVRLSRRNGEIDFEAPESIEAAAGKWAGDAPFAQIIIAVGVLHTERLQPERSLRDLDADRLARSFTINAVGPALVMRHFLPLLAPDGQLAALSARVGSISDNRLGGWYGYRVSKAALNQFVRTAAIELARSKPQAVCVALHPGTVDTGMSKPFQRGVPSAKLFTPAFAAERLLAVLDGLTPADSGGFFDWAGEPVPF